MTLAVHTGDAVEILRALPASSCAAIITDPPYGTTSLGWDSGQAWPDLWREFARLLQPGGNVLVFSAQPFTTDLIASRRAWYRYEIIWRKTTATRFLDANRRPLQTHEAIQVFGPGRGFYEPQKVFVGNRGKNADRKPNVAAMYQAGVGATSYRDNGWRHPTTVVDFAKPPRVGALHPTEKPVPLMRWLVRSFVPLGGLVLDPFAGSGSTGVAARLEGRRFVGVEIDPSYAAAANSRIAGTDPAGVQSNLLADALVEVQR